MLHLMPLGRRHHLRSVVPRINPVLRRQTEQGLVFMGEQTGQQSKLLQSHLELILILNQNSLTNDAIMPEGVRFGPAGHAYL